MATLAKEMPIFISITQDGIVTAQRFKERLGRGEIHAYKKRCNTADQLFDDPILHIQNLCRQGNPIIAFCAVPIVVRAVEGFIPDKVVQQPIMAVSEDGSMIIPILGVHGGTLSLAEAIKDDDSTIALTNATDARLGVALDDPPNGWVLGNPNDYKAFAAEALDVGIASIDHDIDFIPLDLQKNSPLTIKSSINSIQGNSETLVYHPKKIIIGVGCERNCPPETLMDLVGDTLALNNLAPKSVAAITSIDLKKDEPAIHQLAKHYGVQARFFSSVVLNEYKDRLANPSERVFEEVGVYGVAEAAAMAAPCCDLLIEKHKNKKATCAIGLSKNVITEVSFGERQGHLYVIGIGPGRSDWCVPAVQAALDNVSDLVGYRYYLDLLGPKADGKTRHDFDLGDEIARCEEGLRLAAQGKNVALICSGDPGIYAMASLVYEVLDEARSNPTQQDWLTVDVEVIPGISAFQAASALAGAPIGHDFCTISLSDLLTPWQQIDKRIQSAAEGDFVVCFYNPVSKKRDWQLNHARDVLLQHRPATTAVIIGRNLGRSDEQIRIIELQNLDGADIDMLTLVMVGSSQTKVLPLACENKVFTPRGYAKKRNS